MGDTLRVKNLSAEARRGSAEANGESHCCLLLSDAFVIGRILFIPACRCLMEARSPSTVTPPRYSALPRRASALKIFPGGTTSDVVVRRRSKDAQQDLGNLGE